MDAQLQRMIERYELAVAFAREAMAELGEERTLRIIARAFDRMQAGAARDLASRLGGNSLDALAGHYRALEAEKDNLEVLEVTPSRIALKITRCRAWEAFQRLQAPDICRCYCESDHAYIRAFNPEMELIRTKTISAGDEYCDHIWALKA